MRSFATALLLGLSSMVGCKNHPSNATADAVASSSNAVTSNAVATTDGEAPRSALPLGARLAEEAAHRPKGVVRVEAVIDALDAAGFRIENARPALAGNSKASYCRLANAAPQLFLTICEHEDAATAAASRAYTIETFDKISGRDIYLNGGTSLSIIRMKAGSEADEASRRASAIFAKLAP